MYAAIQIRRKPKNTRIQTERTNKSIHTHSLRFILVAVRSVLCCQPPGNRQTIPSRLPAMCVKLYSTQQQAGRAEAACSAQYVFAWYCCSSIGSQAGFFLVWLCGATRNATAVKPPSGSLVVVVHVVRSTRLSILILMKSKMVVTHHKYSQSLNHFFPHSIRLFIFIDSSIYMHIDMYIV